MVVFTILACIVPARRVATNGTLLNFGAFPSELFMSKLINRLFLTVFGDQKQKKDGKLDTE